MVENRPFFDTLTHIVLILGIILIAFPIWITFVAATHDLARMSQAPIPILPGTHFFENLKLALEGKVVAGVDILPVWKMMVNSLVMALMIAIGKIFISILSAYAIVYFDFPFRMGFSG